MPEIWIIQTIISSDLEILCHFSVKPPQINVHLPIACASISKSFRFRSSNKGCPLLCLSFHFRMCAPKFVACKYSIINYCVNFPIDVIFLSLKLCPISPWLHSWGVISIDWEKKIGMKSNRMTDFTFLEWIVHAFISLFP